LKKIILIALCALAFEANASVTDSVKKDLINTPDTVKRLDRPHESFLVPAILGAYGAASFAIKPVRNFDYYVRGRIETSAPNYNSKMADYLQLSPAVLVYALNLAGDEGKHRFVDRTALLALSGVILTVGDGFKYIARRTRPYGTDPLSFPSGHTSSAFATAAVLHGHYGWKVGVPSYAFATYVGSSRLAQNRHFLSDVVFGAGIGLAAGRATTFHVRDSTVRIAP